MSHRFIPAPDEAPALNPEHTAAIKQWTRDILRPPADAVITVNEIACIDAGCPLVETAVAVTKLMLRQTLSTPPVIAQKSKPTKNLSNE